MGTEGTGPSPQEQRLKAYLDGLAQVAGHADRSEPLRLYCKGLLLPGERKSVEPMAARLAPSHDQVDRLRQSLHHLVAAAPWRDDTVLTEVRKHVVSAIEKRGPIVAWIVDDTGFPKKGKHSVGVARQYCGQLGKQDNCRVAVSVSVAAWNASLPIAYQLYLPEEWASDSERRANTGVPEEIEFQTKPQIALEQIQRAVQAGTPRGVVLGDAGYGVDTKFRTGITGLGLQYVMGVQSAMTVWKPGEQPLPAKPWTGKGRPPHLQRRDNDRQPVTTKQLAMKLPSSAWANVTWRGGVNRKLRSRFAAVRIRPAHRDYLKSEPYPEEWLLLEWPN